MTTTGNAPTSTWDKITVFWLGLKLRSLALILALMTLSLTSESLNIKFGQSAAESIFGKVEFVMFGYTVNLIWWLFVFISLTDSIAHAMLVIFGNNLPAHASRWQKTVAWFRGPQLWSLVLILTTSFIDTMMVWYVLSISPEFGLSDRAALAYAFMFYFARVMLVFVLKEATTDVKQRGMAQWVLRQQQTEIAHHPALPAPTVRRTQPTSRPVLPEGQPQRDPRRRR
jgi:hypothetical protein